MDRSGIEALIADSAATIQSLARQADSLVRIGDALVAALREGRKILTAGNGGSAAEALHMAEELVGRYRDDRVSLPGIALTADSTAITCISNDYGYDRVFSRQVEGLGQPGDVLVLFSTSGNASNLLLALEEAQRRKMVVVALLGRDGGPLAGKADFEIVVEGTATERIQEAHQVILHVLLEAVEMTFVEGTAHGRD